MSSVQSPGSASQSSKGSSCFDQDFMPTPKIPAALNNIIANNYGNNYYVADIDGANGAGSVEGLDLEDIDEIDTNSMAIYSEETFKKDRPSGAAGVKKEPVVADSTQAMPSSGKSLLIPLAADSQLEIDADLMMNVLEDQVASSSSNAQDLNTNSLAVSNNMFDETSQVISA